MIFFFLILRRFQSFFNEFHWFLLDFEPFSAVFQCLSFGFFLLFGRFQPFFNDFFGFYWILNRFKAVLNDSFGVLLDFYPFSAVF